MKKADIAVIGLAVMGENLAMNMESRGFTVAVYNRHTEKVDDFIAGRAAGKNFIGCHSIEELAANLEKPRKIFMMVKAGAPVDALIEQLIPVLEEGDIMIDGGNSHFPDTMRRCELAEFVKMVHNGIEYGDMQLICECYQLLKDGLGLANEEMHDVFARWNETELDSYLIEITRDILGYRDENGEYTVDHILDTAGQKGTGKWTAIQALDEGTPLTLISEAVYARCLSAQKEERVEAARSFPHVRKAFEGDADALIEKIRKALYASKIISYAQGYSLMRAAAEHYGWNLNFGGIALMWRGGCIIRSAFLGKIKEAFEKDPALSNLILDSYFADQMKTLVPALREVVAFAVGAGIPVPSLSSALSWFDGYTTERLPANLLQAQRDYFGAHTYERTDAPRGEHFHTNWTGHGGDTSSSSYNA